MTRLADELRAAGLQVTEHHIPGRPGVWAPTGVLMHHTAGPASGDAPSLWVCVNGREGIPGPLCQLLIARSGEVHLISEGRANHAGKGSGLTGEGVPTDQGNARLWGIEVESTGTAPDWPQAQWDAAHKAASVLLAGMGAGPDRLWRHRDYTPRKVDTVYALAAHRAAVTAPQPALPTPPPNDLGAPDMRLVRRPDGSIAKVSADSFTPVSSLDEATALVGVFGPWVEVTEFMWDLLQESAVRTRLTEPR